MLMAEIVLDQFAGQNWLITPAALAVGESSPRAILDQKWLLVLSGVVVANLKGNSNAAWLRETVTFLPGNSLSLGIGPNEGPLKYAISHYSIPTPSQNPKDYDVVFSLEEWAPFASLSAIFDQSQSINAGYAVEVWRPRHFMHALKFPDITQPIHKIFTGISVDVGIRDNDAFILKLGYHITLLGRIAFAATGSIQD
jgi:hypothetical protein